MPTLNPSQAVSAAQGIYSILHTHNVENSFKKPIRDNFDLTKPREFNGKTGFTLMQTSTGFGLAAMGKEGGYKNDALITMRGTQISADWITDAHVGTANFNGKVVHSGFYQVFRSILPAIDSFFQVHHPLRVHVVGHSLGGAVATLVAQWIKLNGKGEPLLYTFGAPRVGYPGFAHSCTSNLKYRNIYRVYHENDPVPMVPIPPFAHVPLPGRAYRAFYQPAGSPINPSAHFIKNYEATMEGQTWTSLHQPIMTGLPDYAIEDWLASSTTVAGHLGYDFVHYTREAIFYIARKIEFLTGFSAQTALMNISNALDGLAAIIKAGKKITDEVKNSILRLIRKIHTALGIVRDKATDLTADLFRWTMWQLEARLSHMARTALRNTISVSY